MQKTCQCADFKDKLNNYNTFFFSIFHAKICKQIKSFHKNHPCQWHGWFLWTRGFIKIANILEMMKYWHSAKGSSKSPQWTLPSGGNNSIRPIFDKGGFCNLVVNSYQSPYIVGSFLATDEPFICQNVLKYFYKLDTYTS